MGDPISLSFFTAAAGGIIKLVEFGFALADVTAENRVFLRLLDRIRCDTEHAIGARSRHYSTLKAYHDEELRRLDGCILDIAESFRETGQCIEGERCYKGTDRVKGVTMAQKFR